MKKRKMSKTSKTIKRGRLSAEEKRQIEELCETKSDEEIGKMLRRPVESVQLYRLEYLTDNPGLASKKNENIQIRESLRNHHKWGSIKEQFNSDELILFENSYVELVGQFDGNVMATERNQIFQAITLDIFMTRHNKERKQTQDNIDRLERMIEAEYATHSPSEMTPAEKERVLAMEGQLNALRQTTQSKTKEYKDLSDKYSSLLKELKATREQRIQKIENSQKNFTGILRMLDEEELRNRVGIDMVIMDKAIDKEKERLSELHTYMNGEVDFPLHTPEIVLAANEANEAEED
jgi:hypothetical protein